MIRSQFPAKSSDSHKFWFGFVLSNCGKTLKIHYQSSGCSLWCHFLICPDPHPQGVKTGLDCHFLFFFKVFFFLLSFVVDIVEVLDHRAYQVLWIFVNLFLWTPSIPYGISIPTLLWGWGGIHYQLEIYLGVSDSNYSIYTYKAMSN